MLLAMRNSESDAYVGIVDNCIVFYETENTLLTFAECKMSMQLLISAVVPNDNHFEATNSEVLKRRCPPTINMETNFKL